jgi:hypothetical protein
MPLNVERVCVVKTAGSTLRDTDIVELRLYRENGNDEGSKALVRMLMICWG